MANRWMLGVAALLVSASAAWAQMPMVSGEAGVYGGGAHWNWAGFSSPTSGTIGVIGGEARFNFWLNPGWSAQLDVSGEATSGIDIAGNPGPDGRAQTIFGGHIAWRSPYALIGVFGGLSANNNIDHTGQMSHAIVGVEAQYTANALTFYYQGGMFSRLTSSGYYEPSSLTFHRGVVRWLMSPTTLLSGEYAWANGPTPENSYHAFISAWRFEIEHMLQPGTPWSMFVRYDGNHGYSTYDPVEGATDEHAIVFGIKAMFGQRDLATRNRSGAVLDMPSAIVRALPYSWPWYY